MKKLIIIDLDDTLTNTSHRSKDFDFNNASDEQWEEYFLKCDKDEPILQSISIATLYNVISKYYSDDTHQLEVQIWTGRNAIAEEKTRKWLSKQGLGNIALRMRPIECRMKNVDLKQKWAEEVGFENISMVFDDNEKICEMFNRHGVLCYNIKNTYKF